MGFPTLLNTHSPLADSATQRAALEALPLARTFEDAVAGAARAPLCATAVSVLQIALR
jgi:hypothetical protein